MRFCSRRVLIATSALTTLVACSDAPPVTAPAEVGAPASTLILPTPRKVNVLTRTTPLASPVSASQLIGVLGGTIVLPGTGLTVVVPAFALTSPTTITATAAAGDLVAYEFEPHGTTFNVPVVLTQQLSGTSAGTQVAAPLLAGYFRSLADLDPLSGTAWVTELLNVSVGLGGTTATFGVTHFSGYLLGSGRSEGEGEGTTQ